MKNFLETCLPVSYIAASSVQHLSRLLKEHGFYAIELDGDNIIDSESYFRSIIVTLFPFDPPLIYSEVNWDAYLDSLRGGIHVIAEKETHVAIVWKNAEKMMEYDPSGFQSVLECFERVISDIGTEAFGLKTPMELRIFMTGNGPKFTPIPQDMP